MARQRKQKKAAKSKAGLQGPQTADGRRDVRRLDSPSFRVFSGLVAIFSLAGLLAMNDTTSIWHGAEAWQLWQALSDEPSGWLAQFQHAVYDDGPLSAFYLRFFGIFFLLLTLVGGFFIAKRLFGKNTTWLALLLLGASLLVPNMAKRATADIYLFSSQLVFGLGVLLYLKTASASWRWLWWGGLWLSFALEPFGSLLFALPFLLVLGRSHSQGAQLAHWQNWLPAIAGLGILAVLQPIPWLDQGLSFGWMRSGYLEFLGWQVLGVLPFIGFAVGGLRDLFYKVKRGEEFSLLIAAWILAALLAQSTTLSWAVVLLAAKQIELYFDSRYPFAAWVRGPAILQLVLTFVVLVGGMIYGAFQFGASGFRSFLAPGILYWGMSFLGVIGLYGYNHRLLIGGPVLSGVLLTMLFWLQVGPVLERERRWSPEIVERAEERQDENAPESLQVYYPDPSRPFPAMAVYGLDQLREVELLTTADALRTALAKRDQLLLVERSLAGQMQARPPVDTVSGWNDRLEEVELLLLSPQH